MVIKMMMPIFVIFLWYQFLFIIQVFDIRNELAHMSVEARRRVSRIKRNEYFGDIKNLVHHIHCLYPNLFTSDTVDELKKEIEHVSRPKAIIVHWYYSDHWSNLVTQIICLLPEHLILKSAFSFIDQHLYNYSLWHSFRSHLCLYLKKVFSSGLYRSCCLSVLLSYVSSVFAYFT